MKKHLLSALIISLYSLAASANAKVIGNGGFVIQCPGQELLVLDYYEATLPTPKGKPELLPFDEANLQKTKGILDRRFASIPDFYASVLSRFQSIAYYDQWILANLAPNIDDTNIVYQSCEKPIRAALRQNGVVYLQEGMQNRLSPGQLFILGLHEWFYEASKYNTSEKTRHVMRELLKGESQFDRSRFQKGIESLMGNWTPVIYKTDFSASSLDRTRVDQECQSRGASFATASKGSSYTKPNCGGDCTTVRIREVTCAKLMERQ